MSRDDAREFLIELIATKKLTYQEEQQATTLYECLCEDSFEECAQGNCYFCNPDCKHLSK